MQYEKHNYNNFPEMQPEDFQRLLSDIKQNGYDSKQPIYLYEGKIVDGWNRYKACNELGVDPVYKQFIGSNSDAVLFIMRTNKRRNLTSSQWAAIAAEADEIWEVIAKQVEDERRRKQAETQAKTMKRKPITELIPQQAKPRTETRKIVAETFNTNERYVSDAKKYRTEKPEVFERIKSGETTIAEVKKQDKIEQRKTQIEETKKKIETENLTITDKFDVIAIDPPWAYEERGGVSNEKYDPLVNRSAVPYPTMTVDQIAKIELPAKENCVLYLWTTHAFLRDAFDLIDAWGFKYKAVITWDKEKMGMGRNIRMQCEFCLLATKGNPLINGSSERDIIREARREHSRKPLAFYSLVERMTVGSRLDYFSREIRTNWISYGAETEKF